MSSSISLPLYGAKSANSSLSGSSLQLPEYVRRFFQYPQMDIDYTLWQMLYLCIAPSRVYRTTKYHKQTKNQWARDDPAFVAIMVYFMAVSSLGYAIAFHKNISGFLKTILYSVVVDFGLVGVLAATVGWYLANQYLRIESAGSHTTDQKVEWLYAFDVHCNSFFPFFILLYVLQYFLLLLFMREGYVSTFLANATYALAFGYYFYVTFLGYDVLPFLQHTTIFLYPIIGVALTFLVTTLVKFNVCVFVMNSYFG
ncbi:Protein unc-50-like [Gracilariopsis chorda]|uniref:Protein unc-50-like n=1 Tax=Gracilariopsis chorda TaxID=448386 RepID=A0A2V3J2S4_9FLOR|nr:Protein unc-50-like [Gracilariopsis chorda]|eukprot:PXF48679.1 Protein unc-50-like [Gracilariopsis chorda]